MASHRGEIIDVISGMVAYQGMRARRDRLAVPMIFEHGGGLVIHPSTRLKCLYGDDGATHYAKGNPGCWTPFCDASNPSDSQSTDGSLCGFGGNSCVRNSWRPRDLKKVMELYQEHSQRYTSPAFFSGYNELIFSADEFNGNMPRTIEAFWVVKHGAKYSTAGLGARAHYDFVTHFGVDPEEVPLLLFDPHNWQRPFSAKLPSPSDEKECAVFCNKWTTTEAMCQDCVG